MRWVYLLSVWLHVVAATAWVGSMLFFAVVVVPAMREPAVATGAGALLRIVGLRYRIFGWSALAALVVTGAVNLSLRGIGWAQLSSAMFWAVGFGRALAWKTLFVILVLAATSAHDRRAGGAAASDRNSAAARRYRRRASLLGRMTLAFSLLVLFFAVELVRGAP